jgi:hypothetical protein
MSINHLTKDTLIDIDCKSFQSQGDVVIKAQNGSTFNLVTPNIGTSGQVLKTDGNGNTYWGQDTAGTSGVDYQGINPVTIGTHYKISNTLGTECENSKLVETSTDLDVGNLNITGAGTYNDTIVNDGSIEATSADLDLTPASGYTIRLHGETSMEDNKIVNCLDPTNPNDVATKNYVDNNSGGGITFNGTLPTTVGEFLKFSSTDASTVTKASVVETASDLNLGGLNILNAGSYDGIDLVAFKSDYDSKVNQAVKTTSNATFASLTTNIITNSGTPILINDLVFEPTKIYGGETPGLDLNLYSNDTATKGTIRLHDETSLQNNKITDCADPVNPQDVSTKNYVDTQISSIPTQVYDIITACSDENTGINTIGLKSTLVSPRTFTLTSVRASLTTAQTSGSELTFNVTLNGANVLSTPITFTNGQKLSNTTTLSITNITAFDELKVFVTQVGVGDATGLKIMLVGNI